MATIDVKDAGGSTVAIERPLAPGRGAASASRPVAVSTEDKAALDLIATNLGATNESAAGSDSATSGVNGLVKRLLGQFTTFLSRLPAALGAQGGLKIEGVASGTAVPVSGTVTVNALPAGTNNIGDVDIASALPAGNNNIGDVDLASAVPAGENHLGEVGGNTIVVSVTPTVSVSPDYSNGDVIGTKMSIANASRVAAGSGVVNFASLSSKVALAGSVRILFFKADPSASTFTDNTLLAIDAADYDKLLGHVDLLVGSKIDLGTPDLITERNINIPFKLPSSVTTLFAVAVATATENLASTSDLTFNFGIMRD